VVASAGRSACLDVADGRVRWSFDVAAHSGVASQLYSSPTVVSVSSDDGPSRRIVFGAELVVPGGNAAVVYCLRD
jgi:hypothetical protein